MFRAIIDAIAPLFRLPPDLNPWQWAEANIDYARIRNYDTEWRGPYSIDYMPYLREPMEAVSDPAIREIWVLACSRGGKSENLIHVPMRWLLATCPPYRMLYIGGQQTKVEDTFEQRIKRGFSLSAATEEIYRRAQRLGQVKEHKITFDFCDLVTSWAQNKQAAKGDSYPVIFIEEASTHPGFKADVLRERQATVPFPKLIAVSSPDPESRRSSDDDPIFYEYDLTDRRIHFMRDPKGGEPFFWRMRGKDAPDGVTWNPKAKRDDGTWDLEAVRETAHYITPGGSRIDEKDRMAMVSEGRWKPTNPNPPKAKRGYKIVRMMTPFPSGTFGDHAVTFLEANSKQKAGQFDEAGRPPLRVFFYERWAEKWQGRQIIPVESDVAQRKGTNARGIAPSSVPANSAFYIGRRLMMALTIDVQQYLLWWRLREWVEGGDSGGVDYGNVAGPNQWNEMRAVADRHKVKTCLIDANYRDAADAASNQGRHNEVIEQCVEGVMRGSFPCIGHDDLKYRYGGPREFVVEEKDPFEGTARGGKVKIFTVTHHPNLIKGILFGLYSGADAHRWGVESDVDGIYLAHLTAEKWADDGWKKIRNENHLLDCECLQIVAAKIHGMWSDALDVSAQRGKGVDAAPAPSAVQSTTPQEEPKQTLPIFIDTMDDPTIWRDQ